MPNQIVYIVGLSHSGSTLLDLILGGHSAFIGLGEIALSVDPDLHQVVENHKQCSCGNSLEDCSFWGAVISHLEQVPDADFMQRYKIVLDEFNAKFGSSYVAVDSSKDLSVLKNLHEKLGMELKVLHLMKDVRNYTISQMMKHSGEQRGSAYRHFRTWYRKNREITSYLKTQEMRFLPVGYEELCLQPNVIIPQICEFLGVDMESSMLDIQNSQSHVIRGNRMRAQVEKRESLQYDYRWFRHMAWCLPSLIYPRIMQFNTSWVYSNGADQMWSK